MPTITPAPVNILDGVVPAPPLPDLSDLEPRLIRRLIVNAIMRNPTQREPRVRAMTLTFVRLVDKMVDDYSACRSLLQERGPVGSFHLSHLFRANSHIESCLVTLLRACSVVRRLRDIPGAPPLNVDVPQETRLTDVRNALVHIDERLETRRVDTLQAFSILTDDGIRVDGITIMYDDLAAWLRKLHRIATLVADDPAS